MILTINPGSSSLKFQLYEGITCKGKIEEIGTKRSKAIINGIEIKKYYANHESATHEILKAIQKTNESEGSIKTIVYRVVHGGPIKKPSLITKKILKIIEQFAEVAPLHNLPALKVIKYLQHILPRAKHIAIFDTSFHHTIPEYASSYAIPKKLAKKYSIQKYGFHGISHEYLSKQISEKKIITCHLGNGSSITAVKSGKSIDTTMGFSPLDGLMMGTRPGGIDPEVILYLMSKEHMNAKQMDELLNSKSGLYGLTGSSDLRIIHNRAMHGDRECMLALDMLAYSAAKYINSFSGILGGADAIVFGGGIGEQAYYLRKKILSLVPAVKLDNAANRKSKTVISKGKTKVYVLKTNEQILMYQKAKNFR
jgi:acetate kinase